MNQQMNVKLDELNNEKYEIVETATAVGDDRRHQRLCMDSLRTNVISSAGHQPK